MSNEKEIWMETTHGRKSKCKTEFKAVVNKVLISTLVLTTILGTATPAFAASNQNYGASYSGNTITQEYGVSVESAISNIKNTIATIARLKASNQVSTSTLKTLANQLYSLESAVKSSGSGVTAEVKNVIANAEKAIKGLSNAGDVEVALAVVKANLGIDSVTVVNKQAALKSFDDVPSTRWSYQNIMLCVQHGAIVGTRTPDANGVGSFNPSGTVTVGQFITVLTRLVCPDQIGGTAGEGEHWAAPNYWAAVTSGMIKTTDFTLNDLNDPISREDMSFLLVKAAEVNGEELEVNYKAQSTIKDYSTINPTRTGYVLQAYSNGLIAGYGNGAFGPKDTMTREQMATVVCRLMEYAPRAEVNFGEEEQAPVVQNGDYFYTDGMVKTEVQTEIAKQMYDNIRVYQNSKGELCADVSTVTLPKALADAGWDVIFGVDIRTDDGLSAYGTGTSNGSIRLSSGQSDSRVFITGSVKHGTAENVKVSEVDWIMVSVRLYHKDYSNKSDAQVLVQNTSNSPNVVLISYPNCNLKSEGVALDCSHVYKDVGLK